MSAPTPPPRRPRLSDLTRNSALNLAGQALPMAVAVFAVPVLARALGADRFGILTLAWAVLGYFGLFDLGLDRAVTKLLAERIGRVESRELGDIARSALWVMGVAGAVGGLLAAALAGWLARDVLRVPEGLRGEAVASFFVLAPAVPVVIVTTGLRGIIEARERFDLVNALRVPVGLLSYGAPLLVLPFSHSLPAIVAVLLGGRVVAMVAHFVAARRVLPEMTGAAGGSRQATRMLLHFGSWMAISNVLEPFLNTADRFVIGALLSVSAVAYYTAPYEAIIKLWIVPAAITGALFPAFAASLTTTPGEARRLYHSGLRATALLLLPAVVVLLAFPRPMLGLWLGADYAARSVAVVRWLAIGVLVNSIAQVAYAFVQSASRPDVIAKLALAEIVPYLAAIVWVVPRFGIAGAAALWAIRSLVDALVFAGVARRLLGRASGPAPSPALTP